MLDTYQRSVRNGIRVNGESAEVTSSNGLHGSYHCRRNAIPAIVPDFDLIPINLGKENQIVISPHPLLQLFKPVHDDIDLVWGGFGIEGHHQKTPAVRRN